MDKPAAKLTLTHRYPKPTLAHKSTLPHASEVMVARFGFEDSLLAAGYSDGHVRLYNLNTDHRILELDTNPSKKEVTPVNCLRWRPMSHEHSTISSVILVANTNGTLIQYLARTGKEVFRTVEEGNLILAMDYAHDGRSFATGGKDNTIRVYDEEKKSITAQLMGIKWHTHGHNNRLQSLRFFPNDANMLASGGWDQNINVWDIRTGNSVATIFGPKIAGDALDVRDNLILSGANRGTDQLQLWDWTMNKVVTKFRWDQEKQITGAFLFAAQFCHHSTDTVMAAGGNQMKIFNLYDGKEVLEAAVSGGVSLYTCDSAYTANKYVMGGNSGSAFYLAEVKNQ